MRRRRTNFKSTAKNAHEKIFGAKKGVTNVMNGEYYNANRFRDSRSSHRNTEIGRTCNPDERNKKFII